MHVCGYPSIWGDFLEVPGLTFLNHGTLMRYHGGLIHIKQNLAQFHNIAIMAVLPDFDMFKYYSASIKLNDSVHVIYTE